MHIASEVAHGAADPQFAAHMRRLVSRCACNPLQIAKRGHVLADTDDEIYDVTHDQHGKGTLARSLVYEREVARYFEDAYPEDEQPPDDIVHVTCTVTSRRAVRNTSCPFAAGASAHA